MEEHEILKFELDNSKFELHDGFCWKVTVVSAIKSTVDVCINMKNHTIPCLVPNNVNDYFDNDSNPIGSCAYLYENNVGSNNNHNDINQIIVEGGGKYRFWNDTIYFSSKDNTSPKTNGKKYHVVIFSKEDITDERFTFGVNWIDYVTNVVNDEIVEHAGVYIDSWLNDNNNLKDKTVIDVGCGSGLSSLCFHKRNIKSITSFDVDPNCIIATKTLAAKYYDQCPNNWKIILGSALDDNFIKSLGQFDIVHTWGVLHHTGNMWKAIENTIQLIKPNGQMLITLYSNIKNYPNEKAMKELYNRSNKFGKIDYIADYIMLVRKWKKDANEDPNNWNTLQTRRGMRKYNDIVDWLGGLPYEVTDTETITQFCALRGLKLIKCNDPPAQACHEWLFQKL